MAIKMYRHRSLMLIWHTLFSTVGCCFSILQFLRFHVNTLALLSYFLCAFMCNLRAAVKVLFALPLPRMITDDIIVSAYYCSFSLYTMTMPPPAVPGSATVSLKVYMVPAYRGRSMQRGSERICRRGRRRRRRYGWSSASQRSVTQHLQQNSGS